MKVITSFGFIFFMVLCLMPGTLAVAADDDLAQQVQALQESAAEAEALLKSFSAENPSMSSGADISAMMEAASQAQGAMQTQVPGTQASVPSAAASPRAARLRRMCFREEP